MRRFAVIPLVSKEFHRIHRKYPPQRTAWVMKGEIPRTVITWFKGGAYWALESLELDSMDMDRALQTDYMDALEQLLAIIPRVSPRLSRLSISNYFILPDHLLKLFPKRSKKSPAQPLTGLQCLTVSMPLSANPFRMLILGDTDCVKKIIQDLILNH